MTVSPYSAFQNLTMEDTLMQEDTVPSPTLPVSLIESQPQTRRPKVYTKDEWEAQKDTIVQLYIIERKSLKEVDDFLGQNFGFYATVRQYKRRIKDWGLDKNFKNGEMKAIIRKQQRRTAKGKKSVFEVKGRQVEPSKIDRAQKRYGQSDQIAVSHQSPPAPTPSDVVCYTPEGEAPSELIKMDGMPGVDHQMDAGIYWPRSPSPFQSPPNIRIPHDQFLITSIPGTPGYSYLASALNLRADYSVGQSPAPLPSTPIPSAEQVFDASLLNLDASISFRENGPGNTILEQFPFDFTEWFPHGTNADSLSMGMGPGVVAETVDDHQSLRSEMAPLTGRRYKEEQEKDYKQWLHELESLHGPQHLATIEIHLHLARIFCEQGRYWAAELSCRQAASISQKFLGNNDEATFWAVESLLYTYFFQGRYLFAETHYRSLRSRALTILGREHPLTLRISMGFANVLTNMNKCNEAVLIKREVFGILSHRDGLENPRTIWVMASLAVTLVYMNQLDEAEGLLRDTIWLREKLKFDEVKIIYGKLNLARVHVRQGRYEESEKMHRDVLVLLRRLLGPEHPETLFAMESLAEVLDLQVRHAESKAMKLEVLAGRIKVLGLGHPATKDAQRALGSVSALVRAQEIFAASRDRSEEY